MKKKDKRYLTSRADLVNKTRSSCALDKLPKNYTSNRGVNSKLSLENSGYRSFANEFK